MKHGKILLKKNLLLHVITSTRVSVWRGCFWLDERVHVCVFPLLKSFRVHKRLRRSFSAEQLTKLCELWSKIDCQYCYFGCILICLVPNLLYYIFWSWMPLALRFSLPRASRRSEPYKLRELLAQALHKRPRQQQKWRRRSVRWLCCVVLCCVEEESRHLMFMFSLKVVLLVVP